MLDIVLEFGVSWNGHSTHGLVHNRKQKLDGSSSLHQQRRRAKLLFRFKDASPTVEAQEHFDQPREELN